MNGLCWNRKFGILSMEGAAFAQLADAVEIDQHVDGTTTPATECTVLDGIGLRRGGHSRRGRGLVRPAVANPTSGGEGTTEGVITIYGSVNEGSSHELPTREIRETHC